MYGAINKKYLCGELFKTISGLIEVYAPKDFDFTDDSAVFVLFSKVNIPLAKIFFEVEKIWSGDAKVYLAHSNQDILLEGKRIIWRMGTWYV